jgi:hypothetical protein
LHPLIAGAYIPPPPPGELSQRTSITFHPTLFFISGCGKVSAAPVKSFAECVGFINESTGFITESPKYCTELVKSFGELANSTTELAGFTTELAEFSTEFSKFNSRNFNNFKYKP